MQRLFKSRVPFTPDEVLGLDRLASKDVSRAVHDLAQAPPTRLDTERFLERSGYSRTNYDWRSRADAMRSFLDMLPSPADWPYLKIIAGKDPHIGVRQAAQDVLNGWREQFTVQSPARLLTAFRNTFPDLGKINSPAPEFDAIAEPFLRVARGTLRDQNHLKDDPAHFAQFRNEVAKLLDAGHVAYQINTSNADSTSFTILPDRGTKLGVFAERFARQFPGARLLLDPNDAFAGNIELPSIGADYLALPLGVARDPQRLPSYLLGIVVAFNDQYQMLQGTPTPYAGEFYKSSPSEDEDLAVRVADARDPELSRLLVQRFEMRRVWDRLRAFNKRGVPAARIRRAISIGRSIASEQMALLRDLQNRLARIGAKNIGKGMPPLDPKGDGVPPFSVEFGREDQTDRADQGEPPFFSATVFEAGDAKYAVALPRVKKVSQANRYKELQAQVELTTREVEQLLVSYREYNALLSRFESATTPELRAKILNLGKQVATPPELRDFAKWLSR